MGRHERKKKRIKIHWGRMFLSCLVLAGLVFAGILFWPLPAEAEPVFPVDPIEEVAEEPVPEPIHLSIRSVGDVMCHPAQYLSAYDNATGAYDFTGDYSYIKKYIEDADLALCNVETTFLGDGNYVGYPIFNSPDSLAEALGWTGFDVAYFANNHMIDTGKAGVLRTVELLRQNGMAVAGARLNTDEPRCPIVDVKGVKIGIVAYTYETTTGSNRYINGNPLFAGGTDLINSFRCESGLAYAVEEDRAAIAEQIRWCKDNGADLVIAYFHWGIEYQRQYNDGEAAMAKFAADAGADIIFASHPHLLQGVETFTYEVKFPEPEPEPIVEPEPVPEPEEEPEPWIIRVRKHFGLIKEEEPKPVIEETETVPEEPRRESWTKTVPVYYSMGNLVSNQRVETMSDYTANARFTEQGMIAWVDLDYDPATGEISNFSMKCLPTWVEKYYKNGKNEYYIIPLDKDLDSNPELLASGHLGRAQQALQDVKDLIGEEYVCNGY
ncbi:MAG: CapA family protein [Clostridia bacterium]|nr:CapA family protein [Clostridia bacterium]